MILEVVDKQGLPHAMMFTTKHITNRAHAETELLLDYGQPYWHFYMAETARLQAVAVSPIDHRVCPLHVAMMGVVQVAVSLEFTAKSTL